MSRVRLLLGCFLLAACAPEPVKWDAATTLAAVAAPGSRLSLQNGDSPAMQTAWQPPAPPSGPAVCDGSIVATQARGDTAFAAWWSPRADSTAMLLVARSDDAGHTWRAPETADSTDHGHTGCGRPAPFIAADTANGYVHVVYFMLAAEGPGIFFTHSMGGGEMFHSPVPIVYGERASASAVAVNGDTVAVAYIDPNAATPQLWVALSQTTGHIFDTRMEVSPSTVQASRPAVAVRGHTIAVAWLETNRSGSAPTMVVQTGRILFRK